MNEVDMKVSHGQFVSIVGESGCGKSTLAGILMGKNKGYSGTVTVGGKELKSITEESLLENITYIGHQSYLFKGTVRDNLLLGIPAAKRRCISENARACDETLWQVLEKVNLAEFFKGEKGLDTQLNEKAGNLSGGQCQKLALARALLHESEIYVLDEATSNIDVESENDIMREVYHMAKTKTVIMISHRLANVVPPDWIYVMNQGQIVEQGTHEKIVNQEGMYAHLWNTQQNLENFGKETV